jgi:hypothetical protein
MPDNIQRAGYVTAFRIGEIILEDGRRMPIIEFEYWSNPSSPDQSKTSVQLAFQLEVANCLLQDLKRKVDDIEGRKTSLN